MFYYFSITLAILATSTLVESKEIASWDTSNVITEKLPHESDEKYHSFICTTIADDWESCDNGNPNGAVVWTEEKDNVQADGLKVVSDVEDGYCIMTEGFNPKVAGNPPKTCKDEFQSSKRFKVDMYHEKPVDLVFDLDETSEEEPNYRVLLKLQNWLEDERSLNGFTLALGSGIGSKFRRFGNEEGISFTTDDGAKYDNLINFNEAPGENKDLDAVLPFGLFGNATDHKHHTSNGYFDPTSRARYLMTGNPTIIEANGMTENGAAFPLSKSPAKSSKSAKSEKRKGRYLKPKSSKSTKNQAKSPAEAPLGFVRIDDDNAEPVLLADLDNGVWRTFRRCYDEDNRPSDTECINVAEKDDSFDGVVPVELSDDLIEEWMKSNTHHILPIEDLRNVNVNTNIKVSNTFQKEQFTLRISPKGSNYLSNANDNYPWKANLKLSELSGLSHSNDNKVSVKVTNKGPDTVTTGQVKFQVVNLDGSMGWRKTELFGPLEKKESVVIEVETESGDNIMNEDSSKLVVTAEAFAATGDQPTLKKKSEAIVRYLRRPSHIAIE